MRSCTNISCRHGRIVLPMDRTASGIEHSYCQDVKTTRLIDLRKSGGRKESQQVDSRLSSVQRGLTFFLASPTHTRTAVVLRRFKVVGNDKENNVREPWNEVSPITMNNKSRIFEPQSFHEDFMLYIFGINCVDNNDKKNNRRGSK
jgi:hypothetical protein